MIDRPLGPLPPDPEDLYAALSRDSPLDWGSPPPTRAETESEYGRRATATSLAMIAAAILVEPAITKAVLAALADTVRPHDLAHRVKSPHSLARKLADRAEKGQSAWANDVLRYTLVTDDHADLVPTTRQTVAELTSRGWRVASAFHSYADGNRYKGIHADLVTGGQCVELQFHSRQSLAVQAAGRRWYEVERDAGAHDHVRRRARQECVRLASGLPAPPGIDGLRRLGGVRVRTVVSAEARRRQRAPVGSETAHAPGPPADGRHITSGKDGVAR